MKLSIIVICLDEERHLPRTLDAINCLDHAGLELELVVVDGGSTDSSREIAAAHGARVVDSQRGIPRQRNAGGRAASGELLAYVDADVELCPGWFETVARHFGATCPASPGATRKILGCPPRLPPDASWIARAYALHWGQPGDADTDAEAISEDERLLSTASLVMGREVFDELGGFREQLGVDEDTFLVLSARERGIPMVCDTRLRYLHHGEPATLREFVRRVAWGANYAQWFAAIRRGDMTQAWRPQYVYGAVVGAGVAALGASLALPIGGWQLGLPASVGLLGAATLLPALSLARRHRALDRLPQLALMYGAYGVATAGAMIGVGGDKSRRWR